MKKVFILSLALILLLGMSARGTFGLFSDTETSTGNTFTAWVEECVCAKFNVSDFSGSSRKIFKYDASYSFADSFNLHTDNGHPSGVASTDDYIYVIDLADKQAHRYDCCGGEEGVSRKLNSIAGSSIGNPSGLAIYNANDEMWVVSANDKKIYGYSLAAAYPYSGTPLPPTTEIDLADNNTGAAGLAVDSTYLYVLDETDKQFYRYTHPGGIATVSKVLKDISGGDIGGPPGDPSGAMVDGGSIWVVDSGTDMVYQYDLDDLFDGAGTLDATFEFSLDSANDKATGL